MTNSFSKPGKFTKVSLLAGVALISGAFSFVQAQDAEPANEPANGISFEYERTTFGVVEQGSFANIEFPFTNTSDKTITIKEVKTTCGCTAAELDKKVFQPGEGDVIKARFSAGRRQGTQTKSLRIDTDETDDPGTYDYSLTFTGEVVTLVELESRVVDLGDIPVGSAKTHTLHLYSYKDEPVKVLGVSSNIDDLEFSYGDPVVSEKEMEGRPGKKIYETPITINVPDDLPVGALTGSVKVTTNDKASPVLDAVLRGRVMGELTAIPDSLFFGIVPPNETTKRVINLTAKKDGTKYVLDDVIVELESSPGGNNSEPEITAAVLQQEIVGRPRTQSLEVAFTAPEKEGRYTGRISFEGKLGEKNYSLKVPFNVYIRPQQTGATPNSLHDKLTPDQRQAKIDEMAKRIRDAQEARKNEKAKAAAEVASEKTDGQ